MTMTALLITLAIASITPKPDTLTISTSATIPSANAGAEELAPPMAAKVVEGAGMEEAGMEGARMEGAGMEGAGMEEARMEGAGMEGEERWEGERRMTEEMRLEKGGRVKSLSEISEEEFRGNYRCTDGSAMPTIVRTRKGRYRMNIPALIIGVLTRSPQNTIYFESSKESANDLKY